MPAAQLPYRYGFGQRLIHILDPHDHDHLSVPLRGTRTQPLRPQGHLPPTDTTLKDTCKRCYLLWREATGAADPGRAQGPQRPRHPGRPAPARLHRGERRELGPRHRPQRRQGVQDGGPGPGLRQGPPGQPLGRARGLHAERAAGAVHPRLRGLLLQRPPDDHPGRRPAPRVDAPARDRPPDR